MSNTLRALQAAGAVLLLAISGIHLYLWQQGYSSIDVIGPAFLLQTIIGIGGAAALYLPRIPLPISAALGALFAAGSLGALILSSTIGLFGFMESTAAQLWWESFWVETLAILTLGALSILAARANTSTGSAASPRESKQRNAPISATRKRAE